MDILRKTFAGLSRRVEPKIHYLRRNPMKLVLILSFTAIFLSACNGFVAGNISKERQHLYEYNNNQEYCEKNPNRCVNNIPWG